MRRRRASWLVVAVAAYAVATIVWVAGDRRAERDAFENPGSSLDRTAAGTSLARAFLAERAGPGGRVETLLRRIEPEDLAADAVVFRLAPPVAPSFLSVEELEKRLSEKKDGDPRDGKDDGKKGGTGVDSEGEKSGDEAPKGSPPAGNVAPDPNTPNEPAAGPEKGIGERAKAKEARSKPPKKTEGDDEPGEDDEGEEEEPARPDPLLADGEEAWVRAGGRLVLAVGGGYGPVQVEELEGKASMAKVFPLWPGVRKLQPESVRALGGSPVAVGTAVFVAQERPVISRIMIGSGEVILIAIPEIFANERLAAGDHLALLQALAGPPGARPVYFDEWSHGFARSKGTLALALSWGFGPALGLALVALAAGFWRAWRPIGPPEREDPDLRSEAVDLVGALGELYDRALRRVDALRLHYDNLVRTVAAETGLSGAALAARIAALLPGFSPPAPGAAEISREELRQKLRLVNDAFGRIDVRTHARRR